MLDRAAMLEDRIPHRVRILRLRDQDLFQIGVLDRERSRQRLVGIDVRRDRLDTGAGAAADDADRRGRCDRHLAAEALHHADIGRVGAGATLDRQRHRRLVHLRADMLEHAQVPRLGHRALKGDAAGLEEAVEAHHAQAHRALATGRIGGALHARLVPLDIVLQDVVEEAHHILDELLVVLPLVPGFQVERRQAADGGAVFALMVDAGRQGDFRTQVRRRHLQPQLAVVLGHVLVHMVGEHDVRLAGRQTGLDQLLEQRAGVDLATNLAGLRALQLPFGAVAHRFHEGVGDQDAVMQVQRLAVEVAAGLADFQELLDLGVRDVEIAGGRTATQRTLADGERQRVHHANEGDDAAGLAVQADRLADAAHLAPIGADAAAARGQPDILVPSGDDAVKAVGHRVEIAADRQAATGAAVRQDRRGRHEPQLRDIIVEPLGMFGIVGIGRGHAHEQVLIAFAGQQIAVVQRFLAEVGQQRVTRMVDLDRIGLRAHRLGVRRGGGGRRVLGHIRRHLFEHISGHVAIPAIPEIHH